jgi:hypothetical protein
MPEPVLPHKWTVRSADQRVTLSRGNCESSRHVLMKAILWGLYLHQYPTLTIEIPIEDKYKPDLVAFDPAPDIYQMLKQPLFWGESGVVSEAKMYAILRRYPETHFAFAKWSTSLQSTQRMVEAALEEAAGHHAEHSAPVDLIHVTFDQLTWQRLNP